MSAIGELRSATWPLHQRLEKRLDIKTRFTALDAYRVHLESMWGFCTAIERRIGSRLFDGALADYDERRKVPLLERDLVALGVDSESVAALPCCETLPEIGDPAAAFGCIYVLEGATLGGRTLLPIVQSRLGFTADHGAAYLSSYGADVGTMWRAFRVALDAWCVAAERRVRAAQTAVATFSSLDHWLCGNAS
jgi:heme oxygenase